MFELLKISENLNLYERVFPVVLPDVKIYNAIERLEYTRFWAEKLLELNVQVGKYAQQGITINGEIQSVLDEICLFEKIKQQIDKLADTFRKMNTLSIDILRKSNYQELFISIKEKMEKDFYHNNKVHDKNLELSYARNSKFLKRQALVNIVSSSLEQCSIVCLHGMQGTGKTQLAQVFYNNYNKQFPNNSIWVSHQNSDILWEISLLQSLNFNIPNSITNRDEYLFKALNNECLIILDDVDNISHIFNIVLIVQRLKKSKILITTKSLEFCEVNDILSVKVDVFSENECIELFNLVIRQNIISTIDINKICSSVGNLPIAVDILAHSLKSFDNFNIKTYLNSILANSSIEILESRENYLKTSFDNSFNNLTDIKKEILYVISLFKSGFIQIEFLSKILSLNYHTLIHNLDELKNCSLLFESEDICYVGIHALLMKYISTYKSKIECSTIEKIINVYSENSKLANEQLDIQESYSQGLSFWSKELINIIGILRISKTFELHASSITLLEQLKSYLVRLGDWERGKDIIEEYKELNISDNSLYSRILWLLADLYKQQGNDIIVALYFYSKSLSILENSLKNQKKYKEIAILYRQVGDVYRVRGYFKQAFCYYNEAVCIFEESEFLGELGETWSSIAESFLKLKNINQAEIYCNKALEIAQKLNDSFEIYICCRIKSEIEIEKRNFDNCESLINYTILLINNTLSNNERLKVWIFIVKMKYLIESNQFSLFYELAENTSLLARKLNLKIGEGIIFLLVGRLKLQENKLQESITDLQFAAKIFRECGNFLHEAETYKMLANVYNAIAPVEINLYNLKTNFISNAFGYDFLKDTLENKKLNKNIMTFNNLLSVSSAVSAEIGFDSIDALGYCVSNNFFGFQSYLNPKVINSQLIRSKLKNICKNSSVKLIAHAPSTLNKSIIENKELNEAIEDLLEEENDKFVVHHFDETISTSETISCMKILSEKGITICLENFFMRGGREFSLKSFNDYLEVLMEAKKTGINFIPVFDIPRLYARNVNLLHIAKELIERAFEVFIVINKPIILHLIDVKENSQDRNTWCPIGSGIIPYGEIFERLNIYKIPIIMTVLEFEDKENPINSIEFINTHLLNNNQP